jgi:hypothetical protein
VLGVNFGLKIEIMAGLTAVESVKRLQYMALQRLKRIDKNAKGLQQKGIFCTCTSYGCTS